MTETPAEPQALSAEDEALIQMLEEDADRDRETVAEWDAPEGWVADAIRAIGLEPGPRIETREVLFEGDTLLIVGPLRPASRERVGAGLDGATLDWFDELVAGAPHMTPKGWIHLSPVEVSRLAAIVATARLAAAPHPVADTETEGRTPCPVCPHWMEVHNDDGTCGCGAHG